MSFWFVCIQSHHQGYALVLKMQTGKLHISDDIVRDCNLVSSLMEKQGQILLKQYLWFSKCYVDFIKPS